MLYLISYELKSIGVNYENFWAAIKNQGEAIRCLDSAWLVDTKKTMQQITDELCKVVRDGDRFIVTQVNRSQYYGWHSSAVWKWISDHLQTCTKDAQQTGAAPNKQSEAGVGECGEEG